MAKWIRSSIEFEYEPNAELLIGLVERACRTCYKSEDKITKGSAERLIRSCIARGHESPLEHATLSFRVICDRGVSHEIVRHRLASYSQESTRYCNYSKDKFSREITCILPWWVENENSMDYHWQWVYNTVADIERMYMLMVDNESTPEQARAILPNCLKTELVMTMNMREIRHFIKLRASKAAHPDIRIIAEKMLKLLIDSGLGIFVEDLIEPQE